MLKECLSIDFEELIVMKEDGNLDLEETQLDYIEEHCIKFLNLVYDIRHSIDERMEENDQIDKSKLLLEDMESKTKVTGKIAAINNDVN